MQNQPIILISGATAGIGKATAELFAKNGWQVIALGRRHERLLQLQVHLEMEYGTKVLPVTVDVRNKEAITEQINQLPDAWKPVRVLVNNAGLAAGRDYFAEADIEDWETMISTNINGLLYLTRAVLPFMPQNGTGHIVNLGSIAGKEVYAQGSVYCATKFAVDALSRGMRIDLLKQRIKVTAINPGLVETEFSVVRFKGDEQKAKAVYEGFEPLTASDVADTIYYAVTRPLHVNINEITLTPLAQAGAHYLYK
ncbi:KR domain-containing protein [Sphingobacteriales bacterium UPWRP_1]|nr:NAD(P)-dependent oxidoreductase [Sphingobacteriales bacterium TSM_CSM]PSJ73537.1 KR domain-containing protein [Sphingobacteriales bacterium UPWRP_1]